MRAWFLGIGAAALAGMLLPSASVAEERCPCGMGMWGGRGMGPGMGAGMRMGRRFARRLGLTADQRREVGKLREAMRTKVSSVRDALRAKRDEMHKLWQAEAPDRAAIVAKHAEMDPLRQQIREVRIDFRLAVHKLLTPAQRAKLHKMKGRRGPGWGRGKGPGPRED